MSLSFNRSLLILTTLMMSTYLLGNASVVLWDRDEPRYAQTSRQMLESGDWVVPRLLDEPREKKPALIYWLQAMAMRCLGPTAFAVRLPSAIFVGTTVILIAWSLRRVADEPTALLTAAILTSSMLIIVAAKMAITDGVLLLFATIAQAAMFTIVNGNPQWRVFVVFGIAQGFALLTKGPVVPAVSVITLIMWFVLRRLSPFPCSRGEGLPGILLMTPNEKAKTFSLSRRRGRTVLQVLTACVIAIAIFLPWWIAIEHRSPGWTNRVFHNEVVNRASTAQEGHRGPPGYYLLTIWGTFLPWSLALPAAIMLAWKQRGEPTVAFALAAVIGPWILFELSATKLPHYLLPVYPPLAFLVTRWVISRNWQRPAMITAAATLVTFTIVYAGILPRIPQLQVSSRLATTLLDDGATQSGQELMIDYKENSLAFYQGGTIRPESKNNFLIQTPKDRWPRWLVISDAIWRRMPAEIRSQWSELKTIHGWNLAGKDADGKYVIDVHVLRKK